MNVRKQLFPVYLVVFFGYIGYSLIITIFTPLLLNPQGGVLPVEMPERSRILALGLIIFLYPFGQFLSSPILGAFSDRLGRRPILIYSLIISTLVYAVIGVGVWMQSYWLIATSLLIAGLSEGNVTIAQSAIADLSPNQDKSRLFGYVSLSAATAYIVGPLLGGKLSDPKVLPCCSYQLPFFAVSLLLLATVIWIHFSFKETHQEQNREHISFLEAFTNLKHLFTMRRIRFLFFINFLLYLSIFGFFQCFPIYLVNQFKIGVWHLSLFIAWTSVPFLIVNLWLTGMFAKWFDPVKVTAFSALWTGIFLIVMLIPSQIQALWFSLFLVGLGVAACLPAMVALLSASGRTEEQGRIMGLNQSLQFFAEAFSGLVVGFLAAVFVKLALIIFGLLSILGMLLLVKRHPPKHFL